MSFYYGFGQWILAGGYVDGRQAKGCICYPRGPVPIPGNAIGNITLSKIVGSQCVLVLQLLCLAACVLKLFVYVRVCASCVLYVCVALSYFI